LNYEQSFKLALLLVNNNLTSCRTRNCPDLKESIVGKWEPLLWKKLSSLAADKLAKYEDTTGYASYFEDKFSLVEIALPHLEKFTNLKCLKMSRTVFHDEHLVQLAQKVPNLRSLTFLIDGKISNIGINALARFEKLEELLFDFSGELYECGEIIDLTNLLTTK